MAKPPKCLTDAIIASLADNDPRWVIDGYRAKHPMLGEIWIANGTWALRLTLGGARFGGVVLAAMPWGWRRRLLRSIYAFAVRRAFAAEPTAPDGEGG